MEFEITPVDAVDVAELLVASADHADEAIDPAVPEVLRLVRDKMNLDAVFVRASRPLEGEPDAPVAGEADPLEALWGRHLLGERLSPQEQASGFHQSAKVVLADGSVYGTLCGFSCDEWAVQRDLKILKSTATLIAHKIAGPVGTERGSRRDAPAHRRSIFAGDDTQSRHPGL